MTRTVLVTGGAGFIGSNFVQMLREDRPDWRVINMDALTYAGNLENLTGVEADAEYTFVHGDITSADDVAMAFAAGGESGVSDVVHFAAESHVDRSIASGLPFVKSNVMGTQILLDAARERTDAYSAPPLRRSRACERLQTNTSTACPAGGLKSPPSSPPPRGSP